MKAIKKISKAAKAAGKTRLDYVDETQSVVSGEEYDTDYDPDDEVSLNLEVSKNWEKIATEKRYRRITYVVFYAFGAGMFLLPLMI